MSGIPSNLQQALTEAWNNLATWIASNMTASSLSQQISSPQSGPPAPVKSQTQIAICYILGIDADGVDYQESGLGTITYSDLSATELTTPAQQSAQFPSSDDAGSWPVECPINVQQIVLNGNYSYTQGCQEYDEATGKAVGSPTNAVGSGSFTQTITAGTITWNLLYNPNPTPPAPNLTLSGVSVAPAPTITVTEDSAGLLNFFQNLMDTTEIASLESGMTNLFSNSLFTNALIAEYQTALSTASSS